MYGWRGKIGLIVPSTNTTCEMEFHKMAPEGVSVHTTRVLNVQAGKEDEKEALILRMNTEIPKAARELGSIEPPISVIIHACTTASFIKGAGYDKEIGEIIKAEAGIPGFSTATAVVESLKVLNLKKIILVTPYLSLVGKKEKTFFEESIPGLKILKEKHLDFLTSAPKARLTPYDAYEVAKETDIPEAEGIFISCTNWRTIEIIEQLEYDTGKPVLTSNQASMWIALKTLRISGIKGYGKLFDLS